MLGASQKDVGCYRGNKKLTLARNQTQSVWVEFQSQRMNEAFSTTFILNIEDCEGG